MNEYKRKGKIRSNDISIRRDRKRKRKTMSKKGKKKKKIKDRIIKTSNF